MRPTLLVSAALAVALTSAGLTLAARQNDSFKLTSNLRARSEVPKPAGARPGAVGLFTGTAVELANDKASLRWKLTFAKLTGRAGSAHIHVGKVGNAGNVMVPLCGPCKSGQRGSATITHAQLKTIRAGRAYVNVHTAKNPAGEIRGQVKASEGPSVVAPAPAPPPASPEPPPDYPYP
jgi:hypothetical protein